MSSGQKRSLTPEEYLARERQAEFRSEFYRGEMFAMAGASWEHTLIKDNLARLTGNVLEDSACVVLTSDIRVRVDATGLYTYPDLVVVCGKPEFEDSELDTLLNPTMLVEVLSDSTEKYDRGAKSAHYRRIPSLREYVLIAQDRPRIERFVRQEVGGWMLTEFNGFEGTFSYGSISAAIRISDIYRGVEFPEKDDAR